MKKILLIGTVDETHTNISGQYDRTEIVRNGLEEKGYSVIFVNLIHWKNEPFRLFASIFRKYFSADMAIFLTSLNGAKVMLNLMAILKTLRRKPVFQIVIGGQRNCNFVKDNVWYRHMSAKLSAIFVEIETMVKDYQSIGLKRVYYLPNCKDVVIDETAIKQAGFVRPYRFCTYSRVAPEKGIAEAIAVTETMNQKFGKKYCSLDIYGTYLKEDKAWFDELMANAADEISYRGRIDRKDSIVTLSQYDLMLFPTWHTGEGVPGGMIDSYEAGLPIIACNTSYLKRIIHDGQTGFVYDSGNPNGLEEAILRYTEGLDINGKTQMRKNCQSEAKQYDTGAVIDKLCAFIEDAK